MLVIMSLLPSVYVQRGIDSQVVHTSLLIVGTKFEYIGSRCSLRILVYEHRKVVGYVHLYINGLSIVYIVSVDIFGRMLNLCVSACTRNL